MATKKRKGLFHTSRAEVILGLVITALIIIPICGYTVYINKVEPEVTITEDNVKIAAFLSQTIEFNAQEIDAVELATSLPSGVRVNGLGTSKHLRGNFRYEGYGATKVFIYRKYPPYILIKLKNKPSVFINSQSPEKTEALYTQLSGLVSTP